MSQDKKTVAETKLTEEKLLEEKTDGFVESIAKTNTEKITKEILEGLSEDTDDSDSYDVESGGKDSEDRPWRPSHAVFRKSTIKQSHLDNMRGRYFRDMSCQRFDPGGSLDRRVNCRRVSQPRWVGARRSTKGGRNRQRGNPRPSCCPAPRSGALAVGGYKRSRGREREREPYASARSPARPTFSYESPGPSFYRRKERVQVYNGGCSSVLTCLAERS
jgi:hypothetical protein